MINLFLLRHGRTDMNAAHRVQGRADIPLNEMGRNQARIAGEFIRERGIVFHKVYSSPLVRAVETATLACNVKESDIIKSDDIKEMDFGPIELMDMDTLPKEIKDPIFVTPGRGSIPEGVETFEHMAERSKAFVDMVRREYRNQDINVIGVSHGALVHSVISRIMDIPVTEFWDSFMVYNCGLFKIDLNGEDYSCKSDKVTRILPGFKGGTTTMEMDEVWP